MDDTSPFDLAKETAEASGGFFHDMTTHCAAFIKRGDILVVSFDNLASDRITVGRMPWADPICKVEGWSSLGILMKKKDWFRHSDVWDFFDSLKRDGFFDKFSRVVFYGASMGGYGALVFSEAAPGAIVVAFNPQSSLDQKVIPEETRWRRGYGIGDWSGRYLDGANAGVHAKQVYVFYDPYFIPDRIQCERIIGSNVALLPCWHMGHKLPPAYRKMRILKDLTTLALESRLDRREYFRLFRKRFTSNPYREKLIFQAIDKGHYKLSLAAIDQILAQKSQWRFRKHRKGLIHAMRTNGNYDWR